MSIRWSIDEIKLSVIAKKYFLDFYESMQYVEWFGVHIEKSIRHRHKGTYIAFMAVVPLWRFTRRLYTSYSWKL